MCLSCLRFLRSLALGRYVSYIGITVLASLILSTNFSRAANKGGEGLGSEELALLNEYEEQYQKLKNFYDNIYLEAISTEFEPRVTSEKNAAEINAPTTCKRLIYRSNGGQYYRMDRSGYSPKRRSLGAMLKVALVRPEGYLSVQRDSSERGFAVSNITPSVDQGLSDLSMYRFQTAPYTMYGLPIEWFLLREPRFLSSYQITRVDTHKKGADELVTVEMTGLGKSEGKLNDKSKSPEYKATFVFHRDKMWALKEYSSGPRFPELAIKKDPENEYHTRKGKLQYISTDSPVLKHVEYWWENGSGMKTGFETYDIIEAKSGPVPLEEFTLEAISMADVASHRNNWTTRLYVLLAGVACIAAYVFLRRRNEAA